MSPVALGRRDRASSSSRPPRAGAAKLDPASFCQKARGSACPRSTASLEFPGWTPPAAATQTSKTMHRRPDHRLLGPNANRIGTPEGGARACNARQRASACGSTNSSPTRRRRRRNAQRRPRNSRFAPARPDSCLPIEDTPLFPGFRAARESGTARRDGVARNRPCPRIDDLPPSLAPFSAEALEMRLLWGRL